MPPIALTFVLQTVRSPQGLPRFFHSLARQRADLKDVEVLVAHAHGPLPPAVILWRAILGAPRFHVLPTPGATTPVQALNGVLPWASGQMICLVPPSTRLDERFVDTITQAARTNPRNTLFTTDYVRTGDEAPGLVRLPVPTRKKITTRNAVGPMPILRRDGLAHLRLRDRAPFTAWDLSLQGLLANMGMTRIRLPLYSTPERTAAPSLEHSHSLAATVLLNQAVFKAQQVRWALAVARRDRWALDHEPGHIPSPREVSRLHRDQVARTTATDDGWLWRLTTLPTNPTLQSNG